MKIMVIGARGQVGSEICALARLRKHEVIEAGRGTNVIADVASSYQLELAFKDCKEIDLVFNCAAEHRLAYCEKHIEGAYGSNAFSQVRLVSECERAGSFLVYLSTDYVFPGEVPGETTHVTRPLNVYGLTKQLGERIVLGYRKGYVARLSHVYGHTPCKTKGANMVDRMVASLKNTGKVEVKMLEALISTTYSRDAARMLLGLAAHPPGMYHCVNQGSATPLEVAEEVCRLLGSPNSACDVVQVTPEDLAIARPKNACLVPSEQLDGLNRPMFDAMREYLADCGHCSPF